MPPTNGSCVVTGTTATCTGDVSTGIDADGPAINTLNINTLTQNIAPTGTIDPINFTTSNADATINLNLGALQAVAPAGAQNVVEATVNGNGNATINTRGTLSNTGTGNGIQAVVTGSGNVTIDAVGNTTTSGFAGISGQVLDAGNVAITSTGNVVVNAPAFPGFPAFPTRTFGILGGVTNAGDVQIRSNGNIQVTGGAIATGIQVNQFLGAIVPRTATVVSNGNIVVNGGLVSRGITAGHDIGNINITSVGDIAAEGGIDVTTSTSGDITINSTGNITGQSFGVSAFTASGRGILSVDGGVVQGADGIVLNAVTTAPSTVSVLAGGTVQGNGTTATDRAIDITGGATNVTVAGTVTGAAGGAIQFAPGTFADRLELHPGFTITGNVLADAGTDTLRFAGTGNGQFDLSLIDTGANTQQYRNFEAFEVNSGIWAFSNATTSSFIGNGGTITGNASFGGLTMNSGSTLAPGLGLGTMSVNGNLSFNAGSSFLVDLLPDGTSDLITVTGATTISNSGTSLNAALNPTTVPAGQTSWTLINATGGVTGEFASVTDNLPDVNLQAVYSQDSVQLTFVPANQAPGLPPELVLGLPLELAPGLGSAPAFLSEKDIYPSSTMAALDSSFLFVETLRSRSALHFDDGSDEVEAWSAVSKGGARDAGLGVRDWRIWGAPLGSFTQVEGSATASSWDVTRAGVAFGAEHEGLEVFDKPVTAGIGFGYLSTETNSLDASSNMDSFHIGAYSATQFDRFSLSGAAAYAYNDYEFDRFVPSAGNAQSQTDGHTFSASIKGFFNAAPTDWEGVQVGPIASVGVTHGTRNALTETGVGVLNLSVDPDRATQVVTAAGIAAKVARRIGDVDVEFDGSLTWDHVAGDRSMTTISQIPAANATFADESAPVDPNRLGVGVGAAFDITDRLSGHIRYDGAFGKQSRSNDFSFGLTYRF
ncbi:MAG: autotransporter domain-containing protein [Pseudomonadota bacterium]